MVELTAEGLRELVSYDEQTGRMVWRERAGIRPLDIAWNVKNAGRDVGSRTHGYLATVIGGRSQRVHRLAWLYVHGAFPPEQLDHINGIRDDNRIGNLRPVPMRINGKNQAMRPTNNSGVMGVSWARSRSKWFAQITVDGRNHNLGYFDSITDAAEARKAAELQYGFHPNHGREAAKGEAKGAR